MRNSFLLLLLALALCSCKKELNNQENSNTAIPKTEVFPNTVASDIKGEYFIEAEYNGRKICLSTRNESIDTFSNVYYYIPPNQDQLNLIRGNSEGTAQMQIYIGYSRMLSRKLPYSIPNDHLEYCEFTQFQFYDEKNRTGTENGPNDGYTYQASTNTGMKLVVSSFQNNVLEGTFEGTLMTNTRKIIRVTNGSFRIGIIIKNDFL